MKALLEGMGYEILGYELSTTSMHEGLIMHASGVCIAVSGNIHSYPTVTLDELRAMAKPNDEPTDDLRLLKERVGIMERSIMGMESKINEIHKLLFEE